MTQPSRVLLVDDHEMARRGLTAMLSTADWITVVGEADGCASGLAAIERLRPDIVLLDIRMPGQDGLACLEELKQLDASGRRGDGHAVRRSAVRAGGDPPGRGRLPPEGRVHRQRSSRRSRTSPRASSRSSRSCFARRC